MFQELKSSITILYPILHYPPVIGGLEQWAQNVAERQSGDMKVIVVTGKVFGKENIEQINNVSIYRTSLLTLKDLSHSSWIYILSAVPFIFFRSLILIVGSGKSHHVDLMHCHGFVSAVIGCVLSMLTGRPFIGTEQSLGWAYGVSKLARRLVYKKARACIASSHAVAQEFKRVGVNQEKIKIIPNGIDLSKFFPREQCGKCAGLTPKINVLSVGRLEKVKGHAYLLDAFAAIISPKFGGRPKLTIVGDGTEHENLAVQAKLLGVQDSVEFVGAVPHDELPHYYHTADVFVMPSLAEGFGIAALEAIACGVPVVASRVGGLIDIISDDVGILVPVGDLTAIAEAVISLLESRQTCNSKKAQAFSWELIAKRLRGLYNELGAKI